VKRCTKCHVDKSMSEFPRNRTKRDGVNSWCKPCTADQHREWAARNAEKVREKSAAWYVENRDKVRMAAARWYMENRDQGVRSRKAWAKANPEKVDGYNRKWREANRGVANAAVKRWRLNNQDRAMLHVERRRQRRANAPGSGVTPRQWASRLEEFNGMCAYCNLPYDKPIMEHMDPLFLGGAHDISNVVPVCNDCNARKGTLTVLEFLTGFRFSRKVG